MIEEATGASWVSPVHIVYKGNGELRLCADLREANKGVIQERFLLRQLSGEKMFSTLELAVVYGLTPKEHWKNLQAMLDTLRASGLRLNAKKLNRCGEKLCADWMWSVSCTLWTAEDASVYLQSSCYNNNRLQATVGYVYQIVTEDWTGENCIARSRPHDLNPTYEPGNGNIADGLSRLLVTSAATEVKFVEEHVNFVTKDSTLLSIEEIQEAGKKDTELQKVVIAVNEGWKKSDES